MIIISGLAVTGVVATGGIAAVSLTSGEESANCINNFSSINSGAVQDDCSIVASSGDSGTLTPGGDSNVTPGEPIEGGGDGGSNNTDEDQPLIDYTDESCFEFKNGVIIKYLIVENPIACGKDVVIPEEINGETVTEIGYSAFSAGIRKYEIDENKQINSVRFNTSLKRIGTNAFSGNNLSGELYIPNSVTSMGTGAFQLNKIKSVTNFPSEITYVPHYIFKENNELSSVKLHDKIKEVGYGSFEKTHLVNDFELPNSVEKIYNYAFSRSGARPDLSKLDKLTYIGDYSFQYSNTVRNEDKNSIRSTTYNIVIPENVEYIGKSAFEHSTARSIVFNSTKLKTIPERVFFATNLEDNKVVFSKDSVIERIEDKAFLSTRAYGGFVPSDSRVVFPKTLRYIGEEAFYASFVAFSEIPKETVIEDSAFSDFQKSRITRY